MNPSPKELEARLQYMLPKLKTTLEALERAANDVSAVTAEQPFRPRRWFRRYLAARDALERYANGELPPGAPVGAFRYRDRRLVAARYYNANKTQEARVAWLVEGEPVACLDARRGTAKSSTRVEGQLFAFSDELRATSHRRAEPAATRMK